MADEEAQDSVPMPPGMSREEFDAMVGTDSDMMDMAATAKADIRPVRNRWFQFWTVAVLHSCSPFR